MRAHPRAYRGASGGRAVDRQTRSRRGQALGLVRVEERRLAAWRNAPNRVTITSPEWAAWLRMARRGGASKCVGATTTQENNKGTAALRNRTWAAEGWLAERKAPRRDADARRRRM